MPPRFWLTPTIALDVAQHGVVRDHAFYAIAARPWSLLTYCLDHPHRLLSDAELLHVGCPTEPFHVPANLYRYISHLRQLVEPDPRHPQFLLTRRDQGYLWVGPSWANRPLSRTQSPDETG